MAMSWIPLRRMGGRVVEGSGLENRQAGNRLVGSNPTPSAIYGINSLIVLYLFYEEVGRVRSYPQTR